VNRLQTTRNAKRFASGSALTEFAPGLFILLFLVFFPMLDLVNLAVAYSSCWFLNSLQTKQAAMVPSVVALSPAGEIQKDIVDTWRHMGVGKFVGVVGNPQTKVTYRDGHTDPGTNTTDKIVRVETTVTCSPFLTLPFGNWPGLSAPMPFTINSEAPMENPDNAG